MLDPINNSKCYLDPLSEFSNSPYYCQEELQHSNVNSFTISSSLTTGALASPWQCLSGRCYSSHAHVTATATSINLRPKKSFYWALEKHCSSVLKQGEDKNWLSTMYSQKKSSFFYLLTYIACFYSRAAASLRLL